ncbi:MAG: DUF11 domain-containing protein, partial [Xanthomonadales bacterium]|nr:DUF11 domain-containing protein [Xanthomonadales bacterium]
MTYFRNLAMPARAAIAACAMSTLLASTANAAVFNITPGPADGAAGSLRDTLLAANSNGESDTINLAAGTYSLTIANGAGQENGGAQGDLDLFEAGFSVTIQGAGAATTFISQSAVDRIFHVFPGVTFNLNGVTVSGGTAVDDGSSGAVALSGGRGGGILNEGGTLSLSGSIVQNNSSLGAAASTDGGGGIYQLAGATTLSGSTQVVDNDATGNAGSGGGIFIADGTLTVQSGTAIDRNIAHRAGGGIEIVTGTANISGGGTGIRMNQALGVGGVPGTGGNGGGLHITGGASVTIFNSIVSGNTAANEGGGLWNSATGTLVVNVTQVNNNTAQGNGGGGIFNNGGTLDLNSGAGPISVNGNMTTGANGAGHGGGILSVGGPVTIDGVAGQTGTVNSNTAFGYGGGIAMFAGTLDISLTNIGNNTGGLRGGGIHFENGTVNLTGATNVFDNQANFGGGVYQDSGTFTLSADSVINSNDAIAGGGGGFYFNGNTTTNIFGSVTNNTTASGGGGFLHDGRNLLIDGGTITGNTAASIGGAIQIVNSLRVANILNNSLIDGNMAGAHGGGISIDERGGTLTVSNSTISNNVADSVNDSDGNGGGINNFGAGIVTVSNSTISGNSAVDGGGIFNGDLGGSSGTLNLTTVDVSSNIARRRGGGLYQRSGPGTLSLAEVSFDGNAANGTAATQGGGGIYNDGFAMNLGNSVAVTDNTATVGSGSGGGIFNNTGGVLTLNGTIVAGNDAARAGGGIEDNSGAGLGVILTNVSLSSNGALTNPGNGGGLHVTGAGDVSITNGIVGANSAGSEGGGLWNGSGTMTVDGTSIDGNIASGAAADNGGGGIFNAGGIVNVMSATITNNDADGTAGSGGGVLNDAGGSVTISDSTITGNQASRAGGGIEDNSGAGLGLNITNTTLSGNSTGSSPGNGGGLHVTGAGDTMITGGAVSMNVAALEGGGLWNGSGTMTVTNVSISGNTAQGPAADDGGGGIFNNGGTLNLINGSINNNVANGAAGNGGGIHVNGGMLSANGTALTGNDLQGIFAANGGTADLTNVASTAVGVGLEGNGAGAISITGGGYSGILTRSTASVTTNGSVISTATVDLETTGNIDVQTGGLTGAFDLLLRPAGVATFATGTNSTYSGVTTLFTGSTVVDGTISGAGGQFTVNAPALLGGSGSIQRNLIVGGTLAPGPIAAAPNDTGILTIIGDAGFSAGSLFNIGINALGAGGGHDQLAVTGMVGMALGVPGVNLTGGATTTFNDGDTFVIINNDMADPISGNFANAVPPSPPASIVLGAEQFDFDYLGGDGNDFVLGPTLFTDLAITKTNGATSVNPGNSTVYTITASNNGMTPVSGNTVTDTFPAACTTVTWTCVGAGGGTCTAAGAGNINDTVDLPAGASVTYTATCNVDSAATGTLDNTATIAIGPGVMELNPADNSATDSDTLVPVADLSVTKDDGLTDAIPGLQSTYTIVVSNPGPSDDPNVTLTDVFPGTLSCNTTSVAAGGASGNTAMTAANLAETLSLPAGSSVTYTAVCDIDSAATGTLVNTATIVASITDPNPANNSATDTDNLTPQGDFAITKDDGVASAVPGQPVTYAIAVTNSGPSDMMGTVSDSFPAACTTVSWTCAGAGGATCTAMGSGNIMDAISIPVGGSVSYSATCDIDSAATGILSNTATVAPAAGYTDTNPANDSATDDDTLTPQADLVVTKDDGVTNATPGGTVTWLIGVSNAGPSDAPMSSVTDSFPAFCTAVNWTCVGAGGGTCTAMGTGNIADTAN